MEVNPGFELPDGTQVPTQDAAAVAEAEAQAASLAEADARTAKVVRDTLQQMMAEEREAAKAAQRETGKTWEDGISDAAAAKARADVLESTKPILVPAIAAQIGKGMTEAEVAYIEAKLSGEPAESLVQIRANKALVELLRDGAKGATAKATGPNAPIPGAEDAKGKGSSGGRGTKLSKEIDKMAKSFVSHGIAEDEARKMAETMMEPYDEEEMP